MYPIRKRGQCDPKMLRKKVDTPLAKSIREEIKRLADEKDFTLGTLRAIEGVAAHGRAMLQGTSDLDGLLGGRSGGIGAIGYDADIDGLEDDLMGAYLSPGLAIAGSSPVENFGTRAMRELVALVPKILDGRNKPSTIELVRALAVARKEGLDDVAKNLEQQIKGAKAEPPPTALKPPNRESEPGAYYHALEKRYVAPGDPNWSIEEYNALTGYNAKATDFPLEQPPVIGGAA